MPWVEVSGGSGRRPAADAARLPCRYRSVSRTHRLSVISGGRSLFTADEGLPSFVRSRCSPAGGSVKGERSESRRDAEGALEGAGGGRHLPVRGQLRRVNRRGQRS
jgi:hypothetical protein